MAARRSFPSKLETSCLRHVYNCVDGGKGVPWAPFHRDLMYLCECRPFVALYRGTRELHREYFCREGLSKFLALSLLPG